MAVVSGDVGTTRILRRLLRTSVYKLHPRNSNVGVCHTLDIRLRIRCVYIYIYMLAALICMLQ